MTQAPHIVVGRISGIYGVRGWVRVFSYTEPRVNILGYSPWYLRIDGRWVPYEIEDGRTQGKGIVVKLISCDDRDRAAELLGTEIGVLREQLEPAGDDEYYWMDLIGLKVITIDGRDLGVVDDLMETGANDVLVVKGDRERLIPFTPGNAVVEVSLEKGVITVDWDPEF